MTKSLNDMYYGYMIIYYVTYYFVLCIADFPELKMVMCREKSLGFTLWKDQKSDVCFDQLHPS